MSSYHTTYSLTLQKPQLSDDFFFAVLERNTEAELGILLEKKVKDSDFFSYCKINPWLL